MFATHLPPRCVRLRALVDRERRRTAARLTDVPSAYSALGGWASWLIWHVVPSHGVQGSWGWHEVPTAPMGLSQSGIWNEWGL